MQLAYYVSELGFPFIFILKSYIEKQSDFFLLRNGQGLQVPESSFPHSANSGDGGDEYTSSEASELDTLGTVSLKLKLIFYHLTFLY